MEETTALLVMSQMTEVQAQHPSLELMLNSGEVRICGEIGFCFDHNSRTIEDAYQVEIHIPDDYPDSPPMAFETGKKIDESFGHFLTDGSLCLGAPLEIRRKFLQHKNLLRFINDLLVPYLFSYSWKRDYGETPFGELAHGWKGIRQYYKDLFRVENYVAVLGLLKVLADDNYRGHLPCPCGAESIVRRCHGSQLRELSSFQSCDQFSWDAIVVYETLSENERTVAIGRNLLPKRLLKKMNRVAGSRQSRSEAK